jgi:hypothetical protein
MEQTEIKCNACGCLLTEGGEEMNPSPCPECGATSRHVSLLIDEDSTITFYESVRGKTSRPSLRSKDKLRADVFSGHDQSKTYRKWYLKERIVDKDRDYYMEKLTDPETGKIVHFCEQKLSEHQGRGSAKKKS